MYFVIETNDEVAGLDIGAALDNAGIKHTIISKTITAPPYNALRAENAKLRFLNAVAEKAFDEGGATLDRASDKIESLLAENAALRARIDDCAAALMADTERR